MDQTCIDRARELYATTSPRAAGTACVSFMQGDGSERVETAYGVNVERLAHINRRYDPTNLFRMNQTVKPANRPLIS